LIIAPADAGKEGLLGALLRGGGSGAVGEGAAKRLVATDFVLVRPHAGEMVADVAERKLYLRTQLAAHLPELGGLFERCKLENVVVRREQCEHGGCAEADACRIDRGLGCCYLASPASRAMLDPYWLGGAMRHARRTRLRAVLLLRRDPIAPRFVRLLPEEALRLLEQAQCGSEGTRGAGAVRSLPFLNPHLLLRSFERLEVQRRLFARLLDKLPCFACNTGAERADLLAQRARELLAKPAG
jgi:hypothetical protein